MTNTHIPTASRSIPVEGALEPTEDELAQFWGDQTIDPDTLNATIRQMRLALSRALYFWPVDLDENGYPKMRPIDTQMTDELRAACEAADRLPRSVRG